MTNTANKITAPEGIEPVRTLLVTSFNAGVPLHVVQRYLGHLTPEMTMTYAHTLQSTAEAEFLRFRKITADARDLQTDPQDLYDMLELDKRTDRVLPNGWCLLPPRQSCGKGNACLTCDKFATDATFLPELQLQRARTEQLIEHRRATFHARTGQQMSEDNVWLAGRRQEHDALGRIIVTLERTRPADDTDPAVRGAGVAARVDAITDTRTTTTRTTTTRTTTTRTPPDARQSRQPPPSRRPQKRRRQDQGRARAARTDPYRRVQRRPDSAGPNVITNEAIALPALVLANTSS